MKVIFVVPPERPENYIESNISNRIESGREFRQKLGILYVAGYLEKVGIATVGIIDCLADGLTEHELLGLLVKYQPDVIGFSALTFNLLDCMDTASAIKKTIHDVSICFGGFHTTIYPMETIALPMVDFIVHGEGEESFAELISVLIEHRISGIDRDTALTSVEGIGWKDHKFCHPRINRSRKVPKFEDLPMPAHHLIDLTKYSLVLSDSLTASIQTSRGCPSKCTFCDIRLTKYRYRSAANVLLEVEYLMHRGIHEIFIIDDTFTINRKRVIEFCSEIIRRNLKLKFKISSRIDRVDREMLTLLKQAGCYRIHYGIETGSQRLLDYLEKGIMVDKIREVVKLTQSCGIEVFAYMMTGIPTETYDDYKKSVQLIREIKPNFVHYSICTPFPKTELYHRWLCSQNDQVDYWHEFAVKPVKNFRIRSLNDTFSIEELRKMQDNAMRSFYLQPYVIARQLRSIKNPRLFFQKLKVAVKLLMPRNFWLKLMKYKK